MNNDRRFEIQNKIITVDQIKEVSDYLQKTCNYYVDLMNKDIIKNRNVHFRDGQYKYYNYLKPAVKYQFFCNDGRTIDTTDVVVFNDILNEPQYIRDVRLQLYISYDDNELDERTEHTMSIYLSLSDNLIFFQTSDKNMKEPSYELNSHVREILESGEDRYSKIIKNQFFVKCIIGLAVGLILTFILFFILLIIKNNGSDALEPLFSNAIMLSLLGWMIAFAFGNFLSRSFIENLYKEIEDSSSVYNTSNLHNIYEREYKKRNEVLIGKNYNNLVIRKSIEKIYSVSKKVILVRILISLVIIIALTMA